MGGKKKRSEQEKKNNALFKLIEGGELEKRKKEPTLKSQS